MSHPAPCTRHSRTVWMAYCPACTAWHLAIEFARRDDPGRSSGPRSAPSAQLGAPTRGAVPIGDAGPMAA